MDKYTDEQLAAWNQAHPVGTPVLAWPGARTDKPVHTYVQHPASTWSWGATMAYLRGQGNVALSHIEKATGEPAQHRRQFRAEQVAKLASWGNGIPSTVQGVVTQAIKDIVAETAFFEAVDDDNIHRLGTLLDMAIWQRVREQADKQISAGWALKSSDVAPGVPRPPALDARQRVRLPVRAERVPAMREEVTKWLFGIPAKQPYKLEILAEEPIEGAGPALVYVTIAVTDAEQALRLGMNFGRLEEGGQNG